MTTYTYRIKGDTIFLTSNGVFSAVTDYGNYAHHWPPAGFAQPDFRKELLRMHDEYIVRKLTYSCPKVYSDRKTFRAVKEHILNERRGGCLDKEAAREEWDDLANYNELTHMCDFNEWWLSRTHRIWSDDAAQFHHTEHNPRLVAFVEKYLPPLREAIRAELAAEAVEAARQVQRQRHSETVLLKDPYFNHGECA